jgi:hypothetical protein
MTSVRRKNSDDTGMTTSATPEVIRSTILSLIPHLKVQEDKKRALILEIQKSDLNQQSVIEYFIGIVGVKAYDAALKSTVGQTLAVSATASTAVTKQVLGKAYCHGGDVAYFACIDLELERIINSALHAKRRRKTDSSFANFFDSVPHTVLEQKIKNRTSLEVDESYISVAHRALAKMALQLVQRAASEKKRAETASAEGDVTAIRYRMNSIGNPFLLSLIKRMNENRELPAQFTDKWEKKVLDVVVQEQAKFFQ